MKNMKKKLRGMLVAGVIVLIQVLLPACSSTPGANSSPAGSENNRVEEVDFYDSRNFDSDLSDALSEKPRQVIVIPTVPFSLNQIPERMDKWLYVVQDSGGTVESREEPDEVLRGGVGASWSVVVVVAKYVIDRRMRGKVKGYNAIIHHDSEGLVHQVTFEQP